MFIGWLVVFVAFSGLGGLAEAGWVLVVARFVTGVAAAFLAPAGLSIITTTFAEGPARNRAVLVYAGAAAGGFSLGMVTGGLLTAVHWRWVFFAPVVLAAAILGAAVVLIHREERRERAGGGFDLPGGLTLTAAMLLLVVGIVHAPEVAPRTTLVTLAAAAVLLAAFVRIERRSVAPLVRLGILASAPLLRANASAVLLLASFMAFQFVAVLYLQELRGWSTVETGLALAVLGIDAVLAPMLTPLLVARFGNPRVLAAGMVFATLGYLLFLPVGPDWGFAAMLPSFLALGVAFTLAYGTPTIAATDGVADSEQGLASGLLTTSFQFGAALGLAVVSAVLVAATAGDSPAAVLEGYRAGLVVPLVAAGLGTLIMATDLRRRAPERRP